MGALKSSSTTAIGAASSSVAPQNMLSATLATTTSPLLAQNNSNTVAASPSATILPSATAPNSNQLKKSKGLYITKNGLSKRLNYFSEDEQGDTVLHMIDDDGDGDKEIFYILGSAIYRKENHTQSPKHIYIKDSPQIFTLTDILRDFFGQNTTDISTLPHDMQIFLRENHSPESIDAQYLIH